MSKSIPDPNRKPRHSLSAINVKKMTAICAICGPTKIRKRKLLKKYNAYICATKKREYAREYRLRRFSPHPRTFSPSAHFLSDVDYQNKTAVCSQCGLVKIYVWRTKNTIGRRCSKANIQNVVKAQQKRRQAQKRFAGLVKR